MAKNLVFGRFWLIRPKFGPSIFFSKIWVRQSLDIMVSYHHVQYQKKLKIQSWEILAIDWQTDGQTEESDFIGRCPTNMERPTRHIWKLQYLFKTGSRTIAPEGNCPTTLKLTLALIQIFRVNCLTGGSFRRGQMSGYHLKPARFWFNFW